jgi:putative mRNA 3-end processing factor
LKVKVLGAAKEVGRSAFLVNCDHTNILMDYGVMLKREPIFPMHVKPKEVDAVVITHAQQKFLHLALFQLLSFLNCSLKT